MLRNVRRIDAFKHQAHEGSAGASLSTENAYRFLFPIGCLNGMIGAFLWIAFRLQWIDFYPVVSHANLMIGGFLFSYALGFLWTAVPRFLQAPTPGSGELTLLVSTMGITPVLGLLTDPTLFYAAMLIGLLCTVHFGLRRFNLRKTNPPPSFIFLMVGILLAIVSLLILMLAPFVPISEPVVAVARTFFLKGFVLCLVLGVGIKLLPALLGWVPPPSPGGERQSFRFDPALFPLLAFLLAGVLLEGLGKLAWAGFAYTAALAGAGLLRMRLARLPKTRSALAFGVWISGLAVAFSPLSLAYDPAFAVHFWHLIFISGMGLLTIFVSVRVLLAHSGQEFLYWEKRPALYLLGALVLMTSLTRVTAPLLPPQHLLSHYAYAAGTWIAALALWAFYFLRFTPFGPPRLKSISHKPGAV